MHRGIGEERRHVVDGKVRAVGLERFAHTCLMAELVPRFNIEIVVDENTPLRPLDDFIGATRLEVTFTAEPAGSVGSDRDRS